MDTREYEASFLQIHGTNLDSSLETSQINNELVTSYGIFGDVVRRDPAGMIDLLGEYQGAVENIEYKLSGNPRQSQIRQQLDQSTTESFLRATNLEFDLRSPEERVEYTNVCRGIYNVIAGKSSQEIADMREGLGDALFAISH